MQLRPVPAMEITITLKRVPKAPVAGGLINWCPETRSFSGDPETEQTRLHNLQRIQAYSLIAPLPTLPKIIELALAWLQKHVTNLLHSHPIRAQKEPQCP